MSRAPWTFAGLDRQALVLIGMCSLPFFLDCLIPAMMGPLAAPISQSLSLSRPELGAVFSANLAGQCLGLVTIPLAASRLGHRGIILWTTLGFGVCQLLTTFVVDRDTLVASRFITGVFLGGALPSCVAAVTQGVPSGEALAALAAGGGALVSVEVNEFTSEDVSEVFHRHGARHSVVYGGVTDVLGKQLGTLTYRVHTDDLDAVVAELRSHTDVVVPNVEEARA